MRNILKKSLFVVLGIVSTTTVFAASGKEPSEALDVSAKAGSNAYYSVVVLPAIKDQAWVGYNSTGSGSGGCISESHWKLSDSRTITLKVKNCDKIEIVDSYFSKDATTNLLYSINGATAASFVTNGTEKKSCQSGSFATNNTGEITVVISADNDVALGTINFYKAGSGGDSGGGDSGGGDSGGGDSGGGDSGGGDSGGGDSGGGDSGGGDSGGGDSGGGQVPSTSLTVHEPDIYEAKEVAGGYNGTLTLVNGREYEVFYAGRWDNGGTKMTIHVNPVDKSHGITKSETNSSYEAIDGWFKGSGTDKGTGFAAKEEFKATERCHTVTSSNSIEMHIKGYDQFSLYAADKKWNASKPSDCKYFKVSIDDVEQTMTASTDQTIRRFNISTGEHVIKITLVGDGNLFGGFSLRVSDKPRTRWVKGNDTTQVVLQTESPRPVYYFTKYNSKGETKLEWDGAEATGITLTKNGSTAVGDTLVLGGAANCPTGEYKYNVVTYMGGQETSRASGKFKVISDIKAISDTLMDAFQGEEMDPIKFRYYALNGDAITVTWKDGKEPTGIVGKDDNTNHQFTLSGTTSAAPGTYKYTITIAGSETVITGMIEVMSADLGENPVLYLYSTRSPIRGYMKDGAYEYLKANGVNLQPRPAVGGLRAAEQYAKFKWILISEDVNADNKEVLAVAKGEAKLPVLNMKGFTYTADRLGWGEPDNGTKDTLQDERHAGYIYMQNNHPIFTKQFSGKKPGDAIVILDGKELRKADINGVMPINVDYPGSFCLATAYTRRLSDYYQDGELQTILHEIPASERGGKKYICLPLSLQSTKYLTPDGKKLLSGIAEYLLNNEEAKLEAPVLRINSLNVSGLDAIIDQENNKIVLEVPDTLFAELENMRKVTINIQLADPDRTHVTPPSKTELDLETTTFMPTSFVVSDYINRRVYDFSIKLVYPQGIEEVYTVGEWVNVFDIYGRKVATTNESIYTMDLPRGIYIAVTSTGQTIKIMR